RIYLTEHLSRPTIIKERFSKSYRLPQLDQKLTKQRMLHEVRCLHKCRKIGVDTPHVYFVDLEKSCIFLELVIGRTVKDWLSWKINLLLYCLRTDGIDHFFLNLDYLFSTIGKTIALLHNADIIHGDLTTSNMILRSTSTPPISIANSAANPLQNFQPSFESLSPRTSNFTMIDFGLSYTSIDPEDKAVDLYVLERAVKSTHPLVEEEFFDTILNSYEKHCNQGKIVIRRFEDVRLRGRKRSMVG
ncbi:hypothetical protein BKA69DRAFT_1027037, partial [Paraphysoderma sedebokerense]